MTWLSGVPHALFAALAFSAAAAVALGLAVLVRRVRDVSDISLAGSLSAGAIVVEVREADWSFALIGLIVAVFASFVAMTTLSVDAESGRRWPTAAGWRLILLVAAPSLGMVAFGVGIRVAAPDSSAAGNLDEVLSVGLAAVPATLRSPGSRVATAVWIMIGATVGGLVFLLGGGLLFASMVGVGIGLLVLSLASSLPGAGRQEAPASARVAMRLIPVAGLIGALGVGAVLASSVLAPSR